MGQFNKIILFIFILILVASLSVNIIYIKSKEAPKLTAFDFNAIYLDLNLIEDQAKRDELKRFIDSHNINLFTRVLGQKENPEAQFYAFCGLMKTDQSKVNNFIDMLLLSQKTVSIFIDKDNKRENSLLGYAVLLVLKNFPEQLTNPPENNFFKNIEKKLLKAYQSKIAENNQDFKKEILDIILERNPGLSKEILGQFAEKESIKNMSLEEKINISLALRYMPKERKNNLIKDLFEENDERIITNVLNSIDKNDSSFIAGLISGIFDKDYSSQLISLAMEKYALLEKERSLPQIERLIRQKKSSDIILIGLNIINKFGNESYYDFLKVYLMESFPKEINLAALKTIIQTSYNKRPEDVLNTMNFILRRSEKEEVALYAIKFHMDNNITTNNSAVLYRLRLKSSYKMKEIALEYIEKFNLKSGASLLRDLYRDPDVNISTKAKKLLDKFGEPYEVQETEINESSESNGNNDTEGNY